MSEITEISGVSRRGALKRIALAITSAGLASLDQAAAQEVHQHTAEAKKETGGVYKPKVFNDQEYRTLIRLSEIVVPADEVSGSAVDAGAPAFIDILCSENRVLAGKFTGGLGWLDAHGRQLHGKDFLEISEADQMAILEKLVEAETYRQDMELRGFTYADSGYLDFRGYGVYPNTPLGAGVEFFSLARRMIVDAFYTSPLGVKDVGYVGNSAYTKYVVPQEAIEYVMRRSPVKA